MGGAVKGWRFGLAVGLACALLGSGLARATGPKTFSGHAAYYSKDHEGTTASGARYDPKKFTCAHRTLPFGTRRRVSDPRTHRSVVVTVNDRGPFDKGRMIDLSLAAAKALNMLGRGVIKVTATIEGPRAERAAAR
ncbi:MAG: septal ring lytic transglycosylase RlpA family protein [Pseudolabrys sp.]